MKIIKRDGRIVEYNKDKIYKAIMHANNDVIEHDRANKKQIDNIIKHIEELNKKRMLVEDIQDMIETELMKIKKYELAKAYIIYRYKRALVRKSNTTDESILSLIKNQNSTTNSTNNINENIISKQRDLIAGEVSKDLTKRILLPEKISEAHEKGIIYFHNTEYFLQPIFNSSIVNYKDLLEENNFIEACSNLVQIIMNVSSSQYGEQYIEVNHLGKHLKISSDLIIQKINNKYKNNIQEEILNDLANDLLDNELKQGINILKLQLNKLISTNGKKAKVTFILNPTENEYSSYSIKIIEEILNQSINSNNSFNLIYIFNESNNLRDKNSKYNYLTNKAVTLAKNNNTIAFVSNKFLTKSKIEPKFNQGIVSINLVQIGIISINDENKFFELLDERLDLCFEALMCRYHALLGVYSNISPIHWQKGVIAKLNPNEYIDSLLKNNNSTLSLAYSGLLEITTFFKDKETQEEKIKFALKILKILKEKCDQWKKDTKLSFILENSDFEEVNEFFLKIDQENYGIIKNITDKLQYSNQLHNEINQNNMLDYFKQIQNITNNAIGILNKDQINVLDDNFLELIDYIYNNIQYIKFK